MELGLIQANGENQGTVDVTDAIFSQKYNEALIHQVVTAYRAGGRSGTKAQKTRSQVRGGGKKPWNQKGSGRARAGTSSSPIWVGGGRAFAASPRDYEQKVNKKMYRAALRSIFSELVRLNRFAVTENFDLETHKTKSLVKKLSDMKLENVLIVDEEIGDNLHKASRNLKHIGVSSVKDVNPLSLIGFSSVLVTSVALQQLQDKLA